ncbi:MAG: hypothetical protein OXC63_13145 [Aestuariivita sp.]|nr:hypothetical protein [Aestuariivita sp.]
MYENRCAALIAANALSSAPKRDLILALAQTEMCRFRWAERNLAEMRSDLVSRFSAEILTKRLLNPEPQL